MFEQLPLSFKDPLTRAIASDKAHEERATKDKDRTNMPKTRIEDTGGRNVRPTSNKDRMGGLTKLTVLMCEALLDVATELPPEERVELLSHMALVRGQADAK